MKNLFFAFLQRGPLILALTLHVPGTAQDREPERAGFNDILVTEIHADPDGITGLPQAEFLEIFNRSGDPVQLKNWILQDASQGSGAHFPSGILEPGHYAILCADRHMDLFSGYGTVIGLDGMPALNNSGDAVTLRDSTGRTIFHIEYSDSWYRDHLKQDGGWSLEMIDILTPCAGGGNWAASNDPLGGTPAESNSVAGIFADIEPPRVTGVEVIHQELIHLLMSEKIPQHSLAGLEWTIFGGTAVDSVFSIPPELDRLAVQFLVPMDSSQLYTIEIEGIQDCHGNTIAGDNSAQFGIPVPCMPGDLRINEILFNPSVGGVDYVELYNISSRLLTASDLILAASDPSDTAAVLDYASLSSLPKLIYPFDFLLLTTDAGMVLDRYYSPSPGKFLDVPGMPNYPDDEGVVTVLRRDLAVIDRVAYSADWHYSLLDDENGVSLERIDPTGPAADADNWHSAASRAGFGTPGYLNSSVYMVDDQGGFTVSPEVFTPDGDGSEDFTTIRYTLDDPGYTGNIRIFDAAGRLIRHLARNETLGTSGFFRWDGDTDRGARARSGLYLVRIDLFTPDGRRKKIHLEVALTAL